MAKTYNNIFIFGLTSAFGNSFVNRETPLEKTILASQPVFDRDREYTQTQKTHESAIQEATTYANFAQTQEVYIHKARRSDVTAYTIALTDWFVAPKVLEINVDGWTGEIGQTIRVKARDNVKVARVSVVIRDLEDNVLEMGEAVKSEAGGAWWDYTTKALVTMTPFPIVEATAQDLPGNSDSFVIS